MQLINIRFRFLSLLLAPTLTSFLCSIKNYKSTIFYSDRAFFFKTFSILNLKTGIKSKKVEKDIAENDFTIGSNLIY